MGSAGGNVPVKIPTTVDGSVTRGDSERDLTTSEDQPLDAELVKPLSRSLFPRHPRYKEPSNVNFDKGTGRWKCGRCDKKYKFKHNATRHYRENRCNVKITRPKLNKQCHKCSKTFKCAWGLRRHLHTVHKVQNGFTQKWSRAISKRKVAKEQQEDEEEDENVQGVKLLVSDNLDKSEHLDGAWAAQRLPLVNCCVAEADVIEEEDGEDQPMAFSEDNSTQPNSPIQEQKNDIRDCRVVIRRLLPEDYEKKVAVEFATEEEDITPTDDNSQEEEEEKVNERETDNDDNSEGDDDAEDSVEDEEQTRMEYFEGSDDNDDVNDTDNSVDDDDDDADDFVEDEDQIEYFDGDSDDSDDVNEDLSDCYLQDEESDGGNEKDELCYEEEEDQMVDSDKDGEDTSDGEE